MRPAKPFNPNLNKSCEQEVSNTTDGFHPLFSPYVRWVTKTLHPCVGEHYLGDNAKEMVDRALNVE